MNINFDSDKWIKYPFSELFKEYSVPNTEQLNQFTVGKYGLIPKIDNGSIYEIKNHKQFYPNTLLIGIGAEEVGISVYAKGCVSPIYNTFSISKKLDSQFAKYLMPIIIRDNKNKISHTSTRREYEIDASELNKLNIKIPAVNVQKEIATVLCSLDKKILNETAYINRMSNIKKSLLESLFPDEQHRSPKLRFSDFASDWEQRKLGEMVQRIIVGLATSVTPYYRSKGIPLLRNMNIKKNYLDDSNILFLEESYAKSNENKMIHENDLLTVHTGSNIGLTCIAPSKYEGSLSFTTLITTPRNNVMNSAFLMQYINSEQGTKEIGTIITAGGKPNLNSNDLQKLEVIYPCIKEQEKIGNYFNQLDHLIALHQCKCSISHILIFLHWDTRNYYRYPLFSCLI